MCENLSFHLKETFVGLVVPEQNLKVWHTHILEADKNGRQKGSKVCVCMYVCM